MLTIAQSLAQKLQALDPIHIELVNESHMHSARLPETHFKLLLVSNKFMGVSRVERSRMVNDLFENERARGLHALSLRLLTEAEWNVQKENLSFESPLCSSKKGNV